MKFPQEKKAAALNADELLKKYRILLSKNKALLEENESLKARLGIIKQPPSSYPGTPGS